MMPAQHDRYSQLVFIWFVDRPTFARYAELVAPVVAPYGGRLDRQFNATAIYAEEMARPDVVNLVSNPTREQFDAFHRDPAFQNVVHLRTESIKMAQVHGTPRRRTSSASDAARRLYLIEIAKFGDGGESAYREYERESESVMAGYGYNVELELAPNASSGLSFSPDIVKIAFFDEPDGMDRFHADPAHARIETELYPKVVSGSIWITGGLTPHSPR
jgi:uncharacterized protein (DUF1330 family)